MSLSEEHGKADEGDDFWRKRGLHVMLNAHRAHGPFSAILHPLSNEERLLVSEHLRRDITSAASALLRKEQETKAKLQTVHIKCVSLMILAACAVAYAMIYLQGVLVPFTLAIFFMFLLEPLLFALLKFPFLVGYFVPAMKPVVDNMEKEKEAKKQRRRDREKKRNQVAHRRDAVDDDGLLDEASPAASDTEESPCSSPLGSPSSSPTKKTGTSPDRDRTSSSIIAIRDRTVSADYASSAGNSEHVSEMSSATPRDFPVLHTQKSGMRDLENCGGYGAVLLNALSWRVWSLISVILCLASLLSLIALLIVLAIRSINDFPWKKYSESEKLQMVLEWFPQIGADPDQLRVESIMPWLMQGFLVDAVGTAFRIISMAFLTLLFLAFLLASDVDMMDGDDYGGMSDKVRVPVRRYIRIKTMIALVVTCLVFLLYWLFEVDLALLFAIVTFILSYIPHVGYTISVLAPLPLVFLDPTKTWGDLVLVFIIPFIIHQIASNLIEPKLVAQSLDLHPIIVLLALAFWTTVWGAVGAILSVPLTAVVRLCLMEFDHPYTQPVVNLLKGRLSAEPDEDEEMTSLARTLQAKQEVKSPRRVRNRPPPPIDVSSNSPNSPPKSPRKTPNGETPSPRKLEGSDLMFYSTQELKLADSQLKQKRLNREVKESPSVVQKLSLESTPRSNGMGRIDDVLTSPPPQCEGDDGVFDEFASPTPDTLSDGLPMAQI